ncbi:hypothetical protein [Paraburkholderia caffeinilytica]|uniref:hypothetical protein n=1 Tax=Paraburkholderia caffeinilytica TaxID=1761016 RepID=UPI0013BE99E8|nr:hypothetical protein [Paraburkholderia caffeinilytica]
MVLVTPQRILMHGAGNARAHQPRFLLETLAAARKLGIERPSWTLPAPYAHWLERYAVA